MLDACLSLLYCHEAVEWLTFSKYTSLSIYLFIRLVLNPHIYLIVFLPVYLDNESISFFMFWICLSKSLLHPPISLSFSIPLSLCLSIPPSFSSLSVCVCLSACLSLTPPPSLQFLRVFLISPMSI